MKYLIVLVDRSTGNKKVVKRCSCSIREANNKMFDYIKRRDVDLSKYYCYLKEEIV